MAQSSRVKRKLAAILSADVHGFSRLMGEATDSSINYRLSVSGFLAEIDRMNLEAREYLSRHPSEAELAETAEHA